MCCTLVTGIPGLILGTLRVLMAAEMAVQFELDSALVSVNDTVKLKVLVC